MRQRQPQPGAAGVGGGAAGVVMAILVVMVVDGEATAGVMAVARVGAGAIAAIGAAGGIRPITVMVPVGVILAIMDQDMAITNGELNFECSKEKKDVMLAI